MHRTFERGDRPGRIFGAEIVAGPKWYEPLQIEALLMTSKVHEIRDGVFERFPRLKTMIVEGGTLFMLPPWLRLLDHNYEDVQFSAKLGDFRSHLSMAPSEYFKRNCGIGASCVPRRDLELREAIGTDLIMWGSDYPHPEGTWPNTSQYYQDTFSGFPEDAGRKILGENAIEFYGLDRAHLQSVAAEIGPETTLFH